MIAALGLAVTLAPAVLADPAATAESKTPAAPKPVVIPTKDYVSRKELKALGITFQYEALEGSKDNPIILVNAAGPCSNFIELRTEGPKNKLVAKFLAHKEEDCAVDPDDTHEIVSAAIRIHPGKKKFEPKLVSLNQKCVQAKDVKAVATSLPKTKLPVLKSPTKPSAELVNECRNPDDAEIGEAIETSASIAADEKLAKDKERCKNGEDEATTLTSCATCAQAAPARSDAETERRSETARRV